MLKEQPIGDECVLKPIVNEPLFFFGRIYRLRNGVYREFGIVTAYIEPADAEMYVRHWRAECYVAENAFSVGMLADIGKRLLAVTSCTQPLLVNVCFGERTGSQSLSFGQVLQCDDD